MKNLGYYNGEFGLLEEMKVPFLDRVAFFGDGIYDATITQDGVILYIDEHINRFFRSAKLMGFTLDKSKEEVAHLLHELLEKVDASNTFLYWQVTRGTELRHHSFPSSSPNWWVMIVPEDRVDLSVDADAITVCDTRFFHCNAKTLNLLPNVLAAQAAEEAGCTEAIFVRDGWVSECAHSNVHILKNKTLITHPADNLILPGIGRAHLISMCRNLDIAVEERPFSVDEMMDADEVIISASDTFAQGVAHINGKPVGGKDRTTLKALQHNLNAEFDAYIQANRKG